MIANLIIGLIHNFLWLIFAIPNSLLQKLGPGSEPDTLRAERASRRYPHAYKAAIFVALTIAATSLELLDFPPWQRTIDAHSLWHLSTAPIIPYWYSFLIEDSKHGNW
jgi:hypothetical protein